MRTVSLLVLLLAGCAVLRPLPPVKPGAVSVHVAAVTQQDDQQRLKVYLSHETRYAGMVQEITLDTGETVVEYFHGDLHADNHWEEHKDGWRQMLVYPATVEGADLTFAGFAMLPSNRDGSVHTTTGAGFNTTYRKNHKIAGHIIADDRANGTVWALERHDGKVCWKGCNEAQTETMGSSSKLTGECAANARRMCAQGAVRVNGVPLTNPEATMSYEWVGSDMEIGVRIVKHTLEPADVYTVETRT